MASLNYNSAQTIVDNLHSAVIIIGENLQVVCMNPAAEMLFHISNARASKKNVRDLIINEHEFFDRLERSIISSHPYTAYECQLLLHHHQTINVDYSVSPIQYKEIGPYLLLEFIRLKNHHKLSQEDSILRQYEASKSLLRGLAHEIKNPLGGIRGAAQLLQREIKSSDNSDTNQLTQIIINEADRLKNLLDRMMGPKNIPTKNDVNIHKILEHVRQLVLVENEHLKISADYDPSLPDIYADESMLVQVILNITRNAVTALDLQHAKNGDSKKIIFKTRAQRNCKIGSQTYPLVAKIDITDNGHGVSKEIKEKIFMPMITGHAEGTGLGLSIAQTLMQQHNGLIEFTSRQGKTVFTLLLPLNKNQQ